MGTGMYPSARRRGNSPACKSEDLPKPDWPKSTVRSFRSTRRSNSSASSARPWKNCCSSSAKATRPGQGFCASTPEPSIRSDGFFGGESPGEAGLGFGPDCGGLVGADGGTWGGRCTTSPHARHLAFRPRSSAAQRNRLLQLGQGTTTLALAFIGVGPFKLIRSRPADDPFELPHKHRCHPAARQPGIMQLPESRRDRGGLLGFVHHDRDNELLLEVNALVPLHGQAPFPAEKALVTPFGVL